ncbi:MAG: class I SAM-dependent methyltransferase, partial [Pseudomonadota bacterium]
MVKPAANPDQPAQAQTIDAQLENARPEDARPEDDWDSHWSTFDALSQANPAVHWRHRVLLKLLGLNQPKLAPGMRILDIGSGPGDFAARALERHPSLPFLGLELSQTGCDIAAGRAPGGVFLATDLMQNPSPQPEHKAWASHAVCTEVLEHVADPVSLLQAARQWMQPGCRLVVTVPGGPMSAFDKHIGHHRHYTPSLLRQTLTDAGFDVELAGGAGFPFFNLYR